MTVHVPVMLTEIIVLFWGSSCENVMVPLTPRWLKSALTVRLCTGIERCAMSDNTLTRMSPGCFQLRHVHFLIVGENGVYLRNKKKDTTSNISFE